MNRYEMKEGIIMENAIIIDHVSKTFKGKTIVSDTSISLERGSIHGLVGRNGSGKTVLMKMVCGFLKSDTGSIIVNDSVVGKDRDFAADTGVIIETPGFISYESGFRNLRNLAMIKRKIGDREIRDSMKQVGLDPDDKKRVGKYSLGMRQRLAIAQAIMEKPSVLILDEPMNGLDKQGVKEIRELLLELKEGGTTILLSSHYAEDIETLCDFVYEIDEGIVSRLI